MGDTRSGRIGVRDADAPCSESKGDTDMKDGMMAGMKYDPYGHCLYDGNAMHKTNVALSAVFTLVLSCIV